MGYDPAIHERTPSPVARNYLGGYALERLERTAPLVPVDHDFTRWRAPRLNGRRRRLALDLAREQLAFAKSQQLPLTVLYAAITGGRVPYRMPGEEILVEMLATAWLERTKAGRTTK